MKNQYSSEIEKLLPNEFLYALGVYMQLCAHIEKNASALIVCLSGVFPSDANWLENYWKNRKRSTSDLIRELKRCSSKAEEFGFSSELKTLCSWINEFKRNRHLAAHGAFYGSPSGFLRVDYVHNDGSFTEPLYRTDRTAITMDLVDEAIRDADRIFIVLIGMLEKIREGLYREVSFHTIPVVVHPNSQP